MTHEHAENDTTQAHIPEPSLAERARTLVHLGKIGSLSTLSQKHPDWPFGSVMPYGLDNWGCPTFLISSMAMHTQNLRRDPRASLLITQTEVQDDPLATARITLMGTVAQVPEDHLVQVREGYLERHTEAHMWVDFGDFAFFRMDLTDSYMVGGFGVMGWVSADDYDQADIDPLADIAASLLEHMNNDHAEALVLMAHHFGNRPAASATMTAVDRLGFHLQVQHRDELQDLRLAFTHEARSADAVRQVLVQMLQQARAAEA